MTDLLRKFLSHAASLLEAFAGAVLDRLLFLRVAGRQEAIPTRKLFHAGLLNISGSQLWQAKVYEIYQ